VTDDLLPLDFPDGGLDRSGPHHRQPPGTCADAQNVRALTPAGRRRGGSRPGLSRYLDARVNGANPVQDLNTVTAVDFRALPLKRSLPVEGVQPNRQTPLTPAQAPAGWTNPVPNLGPNVGLIDEFGMGFYYDDPSTGVEYSHDHLEDLAHQHGYGFVLAPSDYGSTLDFSPFDDLDQFAVIILFSGYPPGHVGAPNLLYTNADFNGRLKTWLAAGGRLFITGESNSSFFAPGLSLLEDPQTITAFVAELGGTMQMGEGYYHTNNGTYSYTFPWPAYSADNMAHAVWAGQANPLQNTLVGMESCNVRLGTGGRALYRSAFPPTPQPFHPASYKGHDSQEPDNWTVMGIERVGKGWLILGGDGDIWPGATDLLGGGREDIIGTLNDDFFTNLFFGDDSWLSTLAA